VLTFVTSSDRETFDRVVEGLLDEAGLLRHYRLVFSDEWEVADPGSGAVLLPMGNAGLAPMQEAKWFPKNRKINSLKGKPARRGEGWVVPVPDPYTAFLDSSVPGEIAWGVRLAQRLVQTGSPEPETGTYGYVDDFSAVLQYVDWRHERNLAEGLTGRAALVEYAVDTETMGLDPLAPGKEIVSVQISVEPGVADVFYALGRTKAEVERVKQQLKELFSSPKAKMTGANWKYDAFWLYAKWGLEAVVTFDTTLAGSLLDENRSNSLNTHSKQHTTMGGYDDPFNDRWDKGHMELVPPGDLLPYAGGDSDATRRVSSVFRAKLLQDNVTSSGRPAKRSLANFFGQILLPAARAFEVIERRGVVVDVGRYKKFGAELDVEIGSRVAEIKACLPQQMLSKYEDKLSDPEKPRVTAGLVSEFMFSPSGLNLRPQMKTGKTGKPSTAAEHLKMFDEPAAAKFVEAVEALGKARKAKDTYVDGFLCHVRSDGMFHPSYMLFRGGRGDDEDEENRGGARTGRLTASGPAVQVLIKHGEYGEPLRRCFTTPPGMLVLSVDFDQGELRVGAEVAQEETMLQVYRDGGDLHDNTMREVMGLSEAEQAELLKTDYPKYDYLRRGSKVANFGLLFGQQVPGWVRMAKKSYGVEMTLEEGERRRDKFFDTYPGLLGYHDRSRQFVFKHGFVRSPLGRVRHLPLVWSPEREMRSRAVRQAINAPIQATLTDMCIWAIALLHQRYPELWVALMIHDQIACYVPEDEVETWTARVVEVMSTLPFANFGWRTSIDFPADAEVGPSLGELTKAA